MHEDRLAFAFAALREPRPQAFGEALRSEAVAGFDFAGSDGERVIKIGGVGEIAHAELIEPIEGTGASLTANHHVDFEFLCVHEAQNAELKPVTKV